MTSESASTAPGETDRLVTRPFFLILFFGFMFFVGIGMTLPLLPVFVKESLGGSDIAIGIVVAIQAVAAILVRPWINPRLAQFGAVKVIMWSALIGALSLAFMAYSPNVITLVVLRLVLGGAQAAMFIAMLSTIMSWVSEWRRAEAASVFSVAPYIGLAIGPVIGQMTYKAFGFTTAFVLSGVIAFVGALPILTLRKLDIDLGTTSAGDTPVEPPPRFFLAALLPGTVLALGMVGMVGMSAFLPLYAPELGSLQVQWMFFFYAAIVLSVRLFGRRIPDRVGPRKTGIWSTCLIILGLLIMALTPSWPGIYLALAPLAIGIALQYPGLMALVLSDVDDRVRPSAISTFTMFFDIAQGLGGLVVGIAAALGGYRAVFGFGAVCSGVGLVILVILVLPRYARTAAAVTK